MNDEFPPYFAAICKGYMYRIYVTSFDVLFYQLGRGKKYIGGEMSTSTLAEAAIGGMIGAAIGGMMGSMAMGSRASKKQQEEEKENRWQIEQEGHQLVGNNAEAIRFMIRTRGRGFEARPKELEEIRIYHVKARALKRFFLGESEPLLIIDHRTEGRMVFSIPAKYDLVIAICELERLLGDVLEVTLPPNRFRKAIAKYKKKTMKLDKAKIDEGPLVYEIDHSDLIDEPPAAREKPPSSGTKERR